MLARFFHFEELGTDWKTEVLAGFTTFVTMAYIIVVNPAILSVAGIPKGPCMVATVLSAAFGTLVMGLYAKRPFAIAPYMGENAFIAYTVVKILGYSWQTAIGAVFVGGVLFTLLTLLRVRSWLAEAIPQSMKVSFSMGIGLFLTFIGLNETGLVVLGSPGAPVRLGDITQAGALLAILGFILISVLMVFRMKGSILLGILAVTILSYATGVSKPPQEWISAPPSLSPIFLKLDIAGALTWGFFSVILTVFVMDFVDTLGTLIGVSARAGLLDEEGNLPEIEKPMLADALATVVGALLGTTTTGTYIESAAGVEEGGKSGFTAVVVALLFLLSLFFAPFFTSIPSHAYGPALIVVGLLMLKSASQLQTDDFTEYVPCFAVVVLMSFTYNIGVGMTSGFVLYPLLKLVSGRAREVKPGMWALGLFSLLFYIFYPYQ